MTSTDNIIKTSLIDGAFKKASLACIPLVTTLEITQTCNFKCHHCYNFDRSEEIPQDLKNGILKPDEIIRIIDELAETGTLYLNLTGGEALLHPHLDDFIRRAQSKHMEVRLKTNGSLLTEERCKKLDAAGLSGMDISLYGFSEQSYEKLIAKPGMFQRSLDGILNATKQGFDVNVSIILHRYNIDEMKSMVEFCSSNSIRFQFSSEITERYDLSKGARDYEITAEQFKQQLGGEFSDVFMCSNPDKSLQCACARSVCGISAKGEVYPCIGAPVPSGSLKESSFAEIWKNSPVLNGIRNLKNTDFKNCMTCDHIEFCNRSSGSIYSNSKDYTGCDPVTLEQAKLRHEFHLSSFNRNEPEIVGVIQP